jgi:geranylgeranyl diphosphate synthase type I
LTATRSRLAGGHAATDVLTRPHASRRRDEVDALLRSAVGTMPPTMRRIAGYHFGWVDEHGAVANADPGKAVRSTLTLLCAQAVGGSVRAALPAAAALELIHNSTLLHDDVIDRDMVRRHRPTAWAVFGVGPAVLAGGALQALAFGVLAASDHDAAPQAARTLSAALLDILDGQSADLSFETRADVELLECLAMSESKTASLLSAACAIGAAFGGGHPTQIGQLRRFGLHLGLVFQLVDDLLGIWGDPAVTGKPVFSDIQNRKKSLPIVASLTSGTAAGRELLALYEREQPLSDDELVDAATLVDRAGGRTWTEAQRDAYLSLALDDLERAELSNPAADELRSLAGALGGRDR